MSFVIRDYILDSPKLSQQAQALSFVVISDLHNNCHGQKNRDLLRAIASLQPDLVLITGDTIVGKPGVSMQDGLNFLREIALCCPVYAVNGNHEYRLFLYPENYGSMYAEYEKVIQESGIKLLRNTYEDVAIKGTPVRIYGYELPAAKYRRFHRETLTLAEMQADIGCCKEEVFSILLAHNPKYGTTYMEWGADLTLSGHYHGGIMGLPGGRGAISPHGTVLARYSHGHFQKKNAHLIVSAGLGSHTLPFRIHNPEELVHITVKKEKQDGDTR